ncbi:MAG: hypothetical protein QF535_07840 [Anaerolineales bacterium]|nr:hypothetical protein [Anaerolineales bacterium]
MSTLNVDKVDPSTGTTLELGTSGDTVNLGSGVTAGTGFGGDLSFGGDTFGANKVIGANDAYSLSLETSGNTALTIDANGIITKPLQPAVFVGLSSGQAVAATGNVDVVFNSERFDLNADFDATTGVFTAPVTGKYHFDFSINFISHTSGEATVYFEPSNIEIRATRIDALNATYKTYTDSILIDMDAADTAFVRVHSQTGGDSSYSVGDQSYFSGHLVA